MFFREMFDLRKRKKKSKTKKRKEKEKKEKKGKNSQNSQNNNKKASFFLLQTNTDKQNIPFKISSLRRTNHLQAEEVGK